MNILYLTAEVPYPITSGYLRHYHLLRGLAREHAVTHLSLTRRRVVPPEAQTVLGPFLEHMEVFGAGYGSAGRLAASVRLRRSARRLRDAVAGHLADGRIDAVLLSGKDTFPAHRALTGVPLVVDICDAASLRLQGELAVAPWHRRARLALRLAELRRVEARLAVSTPHLLFASERDRAAVGAAHGLVVPNGVDVGYWTRDAAPATGETVAFSGAMNYPPNHDAALRLARSVLPHLRSRRSRARLVLAGRDPQPRLRACAGEHVIVTGALPDLRPQLESAAVYCAPLRFASGIQNKLLEAMALELPVVTTEVAAAGLRMAGQDPPLIVADDDEALAAAVDRLLGDPAERARLGAAGRRYVERHFSWARAVAQVDGVLRAAAQALPAPASRDPVQSTAHATAGVSS